MKNIFNKIHYKIIASAEQSVEDAFKGLDWKPKKEKKDKDKKKEQGKKIS